MEVCASRTGRIAFGHLNLSIFEQLLLKFVGAFELSSLAVFQDAFWPCCPGVMAEHLRLRIYQKIGLDWLYISAGRRKKGNV